MSLSLKRLHQVKCIINTYTKLLVYIHAFENKNTRTLKIVFAAFHTKAVIFFLLGKLLDLMAVCN